MNEKYNERVRALAEKIAKVQDPEHFKKGEYINNSVDAAFYDQETQYLISWYIESGCQAVAEMAEEVRMLLQQVTAWPDCEVHDELIKRGLIPDNGQEVDSNESKISEKSKKEI